MTQAPMPIQVVYANELHGGGLQLHPFYLEAVRRMPRSGPRRVFEWCAGPGFIGFSLLAHGLCDTLCLADVNPAAVACCQATIANHGLQDRVTVYHSDNLRDIPATERWDIVVGNPPHFNTTEQIPGYAEILYRDLDWHLHKAFYSNVERFLAPSGLVLLLENHHGSMPRDFYPMILAAGLEVVFVEPMQGHLFYFIGSVRQSEVKAWAATFWPPSDSQPTGSGAATPA